MKSPWDLPLHLWLFFFPQLPIRNYFIFFFKKRVHPTKEKERSLGKESSSRLATRGPTNSSSSRKIQEPGSQKPREKGEVCQHPFLKSRNRHKGTRREITGFVQTKPILIPDPSVFQLQAFTAFQIHRVCFMASKSQAVHISSHDDVASNFENPQESHGRQGQLRNPYNVLAFLFSLKLQCAIKLLLFRHSVLSEYRLKLFFS